MEEIQALCQARNTSIKALERELGLGNGTIRRWDNSSPSIDKVLQVAEYFGVSIAELTGETVQQKSPSPDDEDGTLRMLYDELRDFSEEEAAFLLAQIRKMKDMRL